MEEFLREGWGEEGAPQRLLGTEAGWGCAWGKVASEGQAVDGPRFSTQPGRALPQLDTGQGWHLVGTQTSSPEPQLPSPHNSFLGCGPGLWCSLQSHCALSSLVTHPSGPHFGTPLFGTFFLSPRPCLKCHLLPHKLASAPVFLQYALPFGISTLFIE